jgi:small subunit ribosomal protein S8
MDVVGNFLTVIRNAVAANLPAFDVASSRIRNEMLRIMRNAGYINGYEERCDPDGRKVLHVELRYVDGQSPIRSIRRCSKPGRRSYSSAKKLPRTLGGLGIAIVSTSRGLMRDSEARRKNIGGEILCEIW